MHENNDTDKRGTPVRLSNTTAGDQPDAADSPYAVERITALSHELNGLLDGSLRWLGITRRTLQAATFDDANLRTVSTHLDTIQHALERMAELVTAAMKGSSSVVGTATMSPENGISLREAVEHAAQVVLPQADERGIAMEVAISPELSDYLAGPIYSVVLNALRNAVESIIAAQDVQRTRSGGIVQVRANVVHPTNGKGKTQTLVLIEVLDDGAGITNGEADGKAFEFGYTTKPGGLGLGLALCKEVIRELGGVIELSRRDDRPASGRVGAILRISFPPIVRRGTAK